MCRLPDLMSTRLAKHWNLFWVVQWLRIRLLMQEHQEAWVRSLGGEDPLEKKMAMYSSILDLEISWTEGPEGLYSMGLQRVRHN